LAWWGTRCPRRPGSPARIKSSELSTFSFFGLVADARSDDSVVGGVCHAVCVRLPASHTTSDKQRRRAAGARLVPF
jgi:hypothetical protein